MFFRMNREKMAGENLREGNMEVAFELWIERDRAGSDTPGRIPSRLTVIRESDIGSRNGFPVLYKVQKSLLNLGGTTDYSSP